MNNILDKLDKPPRTSQEDAKELSVDMDLEEKNYSDKELFDLISDERYRKAALSYVSTSSKNVALLSFALVYSRDTSSRNTLANKIFEQYKDVESLVPLANDPALEVSARAWKQILAAQSKHVLLYFLQYSRLSKRVDVAAQVLLDKYPEESTFRRVLENTSVFDGTRALAAKWLLALYQPCYLDRPSTATENLMSMIRFLIPAKPFEFR